MLVATIVAACAGVLVGLLRGGRIEYLARLPIRLAWLAGLAWLIQVGLFVSPLAAALDAWAAPIHLATIAKEIDRHAPVWLDQGAQPT